MKENEKNRINYLDYLKCIAIILVIYVHYPWTNNSVASNLTLMIVVIAVPLFFMVNGNLLLNKPTDIKNHLKKVLLIFVSLVAWKAIILLICVVTKRIDINSIHKLDIFYYLISSKNINRVPAEHLWFMYSLLKVYLVVPILKLAIDSNKEIIKYILIVSFILSFGMEILNNISLLTNKMFNLEIINFYTIGNTYNPVTNDMNYIFFFIFGKYLHDKYYKVKLEKKAIILNILLIIVGYLMLVGVYYLQRGTLTGEYQGIKNNYTQPGTLLIAYVLFKTFAQLDCGPNRLIKFLGRKTGNVYYIHMLVAAYLVDYIYKYAINYSGILLNILRTVIVLVISIVITEILSKIKPIKRVLNLS